MGSKGFKSKLSLWHIHATLLISRQHCQNDGLKNNYKNSISIKQPVKLAIFLVFPYENKRGSKENKISQVAVE